MALFFSTIINKMDAKCRVSVPSSFRSSLQKQSFNGLIAFPSYQNNSIDACGIDRMESISDSLDNSNDYTKEEFYEKFGEGSTFPQLILDGIHLGGCQESIKYMQEEKICCQV